MNFRRRLVQEPMQFQLAPFIDVVMFLLCFFLLTWNMARYEQDLEVKLPTAEHGKPAEAHLDAPVINVRADGAIVLNNEEIDEVRLEETFRGLVTAAQVFARGKGQEVQPPAVILRIDEATNYRDVMRVLDIARGADIWNIAFATGQPEDQAN